MISIRPVSGIWGRSIGDSNYLIGLGGFGEAGYRFRGWQGAFITSFTISHRSLGRYFYIPLKKKTLGNTEGKTELAKKIESTGG